TGAGRARTCRRLGAADRRGPGRRRRGAAAAHPAFQQLAVRWGCPGSPGTGRARARPAPAPPRPVVPEKRMNAFRLALPVLAILLLAACVSQPGPLRGDYAPITPAEAVDHDATGAMVRWGGRVVRVDPKQGRTCFEIISTRLYANGRPRWASDEVRGRFLACRAGFYDPAVFEKNREVTFVGRI